MLCLDATKYVESALSESVAWAAVESSRSSGSSRSSRIGARVWKGVPLVSSLFLVESAHREFV